MVSRSFSFFAIWHNECRTLRGIGLPIAVIFYSEWFLRSFWVYRVFYCIQRRVGYIIRLHFRRFKLAVSIRAPALTRNKGSVEGKQESVLEMVAKVRRADGSHLIEAGWTPDIEAQGSADQQLGTKISGAYFGESC